MSDDKALNEQLDRLAAKGGRVIDAKRVLAESGSPDFLSAIQLEIDTAVLTRTLTFSADASHVTVIAGGRRLIKLSATSDDITFPAQYVDAVLSAEDIDALHAIKAAFQALESAAAPLLVDSSEYTGRSSGSNAGVSSGQLVDAWAATPTTSAPDPVSEPESGPESESETGLVAFTNAITDIAKAHIVLASGAVTASKGTKPAIKMLTETAGAQLPDLSATGEADPRFICLQNAAKKNLSLAVALSGDDSVVLSYDTKSLNAIMAAWAEATGR